MKRAESTNPRAVRVTAVSLGTVADAAAVPVRLATGHRFGSSRRRGALPAARRVRPAVGGLLGGGGDIALGTAPVWDRAWL